MRAGVDGVLAAEAELVASGADLRADVITAGHHGSDTSSTEEFLNAVKPRYAVIQVGKDNDFGHPSRVKQLRIIPEPPSTLQLKMSLNEELVF